MSATQLVRDLFASEIGRTIEEVIKVDQTDDEILGEEISEYVVTDAIRRHFTEIFDRYRETPNKPHDGVAIWVSGFFGSGKSSFAKTSGPTGTTGPPTAGKSAARRITPARIPTPPPRPSLSPPGAGAAATSPPSSVRQS